MYEDNASKDNDTLGGRLWRAREAAGYNELKFARSIGIKKETLAAWESDRSEPRANKLVTIAGLLNVSPAWLLHGIGESPIDDAISEELQLIRAQLERIREFRMQTDIAISNIEGALERITARENEI